MIPIGPFRMTKRTSRQGSDGQNSFLFVLSASASILLVNAVQLNRHPGNNLTSFVFNNFEEFVLARI